MKDELVALVEKMISGGIYFDEAVREFEKQFIFQTIARHANNLSKASAALGIHRNTLSKRLQEYQTGNSDNVVAPSKKRQIAPRRKAKLQFATR